MEFKKNIEWVSMNYNLRSWYEEGEKFMVNEVWI